MVKLGNITLDVPFFQAPLSGYSDYAMRKLAIIHGAPLTFAGVMLAKSMVNPKVLRKPIFTPGDDEHPIGAQILGTKPQTMAKAAKALVEVGYDLIDLNFACPAPKVLRRKRGGFLLNHPETVMEIFQRVRQAVDCPVLMKLRIGFDNTQASHDNFWKIASWASTEGVDGLVVHGRTVSKKFTGSADWQILTELKRQFPQTTIIGSGDLFSTEAVTELLRTTGIDGAAIARGAIGNPWIFSHLRATLNGKPRLPAPSLGEQAEIMLKHFGLLCQLYGQAKAVRYFRKFIVGYCKLHPQSKKTQKSLITAGNKEQLLLAIKECYQQ